MRINTLPIKYYTGDMSHMYMLGSIHEEGT